jgi:hypothetical protein
MWGDCINDMAAGVTLALSRFPVLQDLRVTPGVLFPIDRRGAAAKFKL